MNAGFQSFCRQLESTLIVALAGGSVDERFGSDFAATLQTGFGDERSSDTRAEQIDVFVASLPLQHRKCKVTAKFFTNINQFG